MRGSLVLVSTLAALVPLAAIGACASDYSAAEGEPLGEGGTDALTEGGVDGSATDAPTGPCPSGRGPSMILVEATPTARFCIDTTETTRAQYQAFLDTGPTTTTQAPECIWNTSFAPSTGDVDFTQGSMPMAKVDWCDAAAFCKWAGKRLCGGLGGGGPRIARDAGNDPLKSEWMVACTRNGTRPFPYGQTQDKTACNTDGARSVALPVGTQPTCAGAYDGLFDMSGNVVEWDNACDDLNASGAGTCRVRGGSWATNGYCTYGTGETFSLAASDWGIRCCADPLR